jgi:hypothetical protein
MVLNFVPFPISDTGDRKHNCVWHVKTSFHQRKLGHLNSNRAVMIR